MPELLISLAQVVFAQRQLLATIALSRHRHHILASLAKSQDIVGSQFHCADCILRIWRRGIDRLIKLPNQVSLPKSHRFRRSRNFWINLKDLYLDFVRSAIRLSIGSRSGTTATSQRTYYEETEPDDISAQLHRVCSFRQTSCVLKGET